jgi:hypothetical protein
MIDENKLDAIVSEIRSRAEWEEQYYTGDENNHIAEYVDSIGYGGEMLHMVEDRIRDDYDIKRDTTDDEYQYLKSLLKLDQREAAEKIRELCTLDFDHTYHSNLYEICSMQLGELEIDISDIDGIKELTLEEIEYVVRQCRDFAHISTYADGSMANYIHIDMSYSRWYLSLDMDKVSEAAEAAKSAPVTKLTKLKLILGGVRLKI